MPGLTRELVNNVHEDLYSRIEALETPGTSTILDLKRDFGATGNGDDDDLLALNDAIGYMNDAGTLVSLYVPDGDYLLSDSPAAITASRCRIWGNGEASRFNMAGNRGQFFELQGRWGSVDRLNLICTGDPGTEHAFKVDGPDCRIQDIRAMELGGVLKQGSVDGAARIFCFNLQGTITEAGTTANWWDIAQAAGSRYLDSHFTGGLVGDNGAYWKLNGSVANSVDGVWIMGNTTFSNPGPGGITGKQYAYNFDGTAGAINNIRVIANGSDGADTASIFVRLASDIDNCRNWIFSHNRMESAAGVAIDFSDSAVTKRSECFTFTNNTWFVGNDDTTSVPITFSGATLRSVDVSNNQIKKEGTGAMPAIFQWSCEDFTCNGNKVVLADGDTAPTYIFKTTADVSQYNVTGNVTPTPSTDYFNHASYATTSVKRKITIANPSSVKRLIYSMGGRFTTAGASATNYALIAGLSDQSITAGLGTTATASSNNLPFYFVAADYALTGFDTKMQIRLVGSQGGTAPAQTMTLNLYPVTISSANYSLGSVVSGSTVAINFNGTNAYKADVSSTFAAPSDGAYIFVYTLSGTPAANCAVAAQLFAWNAK